MRTYFRIFRILLLLVILFSFTNSSAQDAQEGIPVSDASGVQIGVLPYVTSLYMAPDLSGAPVGVVSSMSNPRAVFQNDSLSVTVVTTSGDIVLYADSSSLVYNAAEGGALPATTKSHSSWILLVILGVVGIGSFAGLWYVSNKVFDTDTGIWELKSFSIPVSASNSSKVTIVALSGPLTLGPAVADADAMGQLLRTGRVKALQEAGDKFEAWLLSAILHPGNMVSLENLESMLVTFLRAPAEHGWSNDLITARQGLKLLDAGFKTINLGNDAQRIRAADAQGAAEGASYLAFLSASKQEANSFTAAFSFFSQAIRNGRDAATPSVSGNDASKDEETRS